MNELKTNELKTNEPKKSTRRQDKEAPAPRMQRPSGEPACAGGTCSCVPAPTSLDHSHKAPAVRGSQTLSRKPMLLRAPIIPSSVLSTTNLLKWLATNFPDGLMVADLRIASHKSCVHFVDSSRIGRCGQDGACPEYAFQASGPSRIGSNPIDEVFMSPCWRLRLAVVLGLSLLIAHSLEAASYKVLHAFGKNDRQCVLSGALSPQGQFCFLLFCAETRVFLK